MRKCDVPEVKNASEQEFEAPVLTVLGHAREVIQGGIISGYDHRGMSAPSLEFELDAERS